MTEEEINKIFSWLPYRDSWVIDRNQVHDHIESYYGELINKLTKNSLFATYYSEAGGLSNYLEFICYPNGQTTYEGNAILVCISLCAPLAAYGQITLSMGINFIGWNGLFEADKIGDIPDSSLLSIKNEIKSILQQHHLLLLDKDLASKPLPKEIAEVLHYENHNEGTQYLQGIFQKTD